VIESGILPEKPFEEESVLEYDIGASLEETVGLHNFEFHN